MSKQRRSDHLHPRHLSREELTLWMEVTRTVTPRPGVRAPGSLDPAANTKPPDAVAERDEFLGVAPEHTRPPKGPYRPAALPLAPLERRLRQRLSRGQIEIDMKIDLHGMRQVEAHTALRNFLLRARLNEAKVVLVVTGKGKNKVDDDEIHHFGEAGVLRRYVPQWLAAPDLRNLVLGFEQAAPTHGGSGALYVRLRGKRHFAGHTP